MPEDFTVKAAKKIAALPVRQWLDSNIWIDPKKVIVQCRYLATKMIDINRNYNKLLSDGSFYNQYDFFAKFSFIMDYCLFNTIDIYDKNSEKKMICDIKKDQMVFWVDQCRELYLKNPNCPAEHYWINAKRLYYIGKFKESALFAEKSLRKDPTFLPAHGTCAWGYISANLKAKSRNERIANAKIALYHYEKYLQVPSKSNSYMLLYIHICTDLERFDEAIQMMDKVIVLSKKGGDPEEKTRNFEVWRQDLVAKKAKAR